MSPAMLRLLNQLSNHAKARLYRRLGHGTLSDSKRELRAKLVELDPTINHVPDQQKGGT